MLECKNHVLCEKNTAKIIAEITRYGIEILEISESRCMVTGLGRLKALTGENIIYSVREYSGSGNNHVKEGCSMLGQLKADK